MTRELRPGAGGVPDERRKGPPGLGNDQERGRLRPEVAADRLRGDAGRGDPGDPAPAAAAAAAPALPRRFFARWPPAPASCRASSRTMSSPRCSSSWTAARCRPYTPTRGCPWTNGSRRRCWSRSTAARPRWPRGRRCSRSRSPPPRPLDRQRAETVRRAGDPVGDAAQHLAGHRQAEAEKDQRGHRGPGRPHPGNGGIHRRAGRRIRPVHRPLRPFRRRQHPHQPDGRPRGRRRR